MANGENTAAAEMANGAEEGGTGWNIDHEVPCLQLLLAGLEGLREFNPEMQEVFAKVGMIFWTLRGYHSSQ